MSGTLCDNALALVDKRRAFSASILHLTGDLPGTKLTRPAARLAAFAPLRVYGHLAVDGAREAVTLSSNLQRTAGLTTVLNRTTDHAVHEL